MDIRRPPLPIVQDRLDVDFPNDPRIAAMKRFIDGQQASNGNFSRMEKTYLAYITSQTIYENFIEVQRGVKRRQLVNNLDLSKDVNSDTVSSNQTTVNIQDATFKSLSSMGLSNSNSDYQNSSKDSAFQPYVSDGNSTSGISKTLQKTAQSLPTRKVDELPNQPPKFQPKTKTPPLDDRIDAKMLDQFELAANTPVKNSSDDDFDLQDSSTGQPIAPSMSKQGSVQTPSVNLHMNDSLKPQIPRKKK